MSQRQRLSRHLAAIATLALAAVGVVVVHSPAQADGVPPGTLVFVKDHNVWMARGDGSGQVRITSDGTATSRYTSPTMSDAGTIAAVDGPQIVLMAKNGSVMRRITPPALPTSTGHQTQGTVTSAAISPDGKTIAFSALQVNPALRSAVGYVTAATGAPTGLTTYWSNPSWVTNSRTLQDGGYGSHAMLHEIAGASQHWFDDEDVYGPDHDDLSDLEVSRDGRWLIAVRGYGSGKHIIWYRVNGSAQTGAAPADPTPACNTNPDASFEDPTVSPDGSAAAWTEGDGIWIKDGLTDCDSPQPRLAIPDASEASWSKHSYSVPSVPQTLKNTKKPTITGTAKVGKTLKASKGSWQPAPKSYAFTWYRGSKVIAGATTAKYKLTKKDKGKKIRVKVTARKPGATAGSATSKATNEVKK